MTENEQTRPTSTNYRKPPAEHQFKKGKSGNPNGRPRKKKAANTVFGALGGGIANQLSAIAMEEASRPVTVREGDQVSEVPALQALLRTMFRASAQGDTKAGRQLLELISQTESTRTETTTKILEFALQYKERYTPVFDLHDRLGDKPPDIYPHPDDVIINSVTGEVTVDGPNSKEEAGALKAMRKSVFEKGLRYLEVEAALAKDPTNRELKRELNELKQHYDYFKKDLARLQRRHAARECRRALEPKPSRNKKKSSGVKE